MYSTGLRYSHPELSNGHNTLPATLERSLLQIGGRWGEAGYLRDDTTPGTALAPYDKVRAAPLREHQQKGFITRMIMDVVLCISGLSNSVVTLPH